MFVRVEGEVPSAESLLYSEITYKEPRLTLDDRVYEQGAAYRLVGCLGGGVRIWQTCPL